MRMKERIIIFYILWFLFSLGFLKIITLEFVFSCLHRPTDFSTEHFDPPAPIGRFVGPRHPRERSDGPPNPREFSYCPLDGSSR